MRDVARLDQAIADEVFRVFASFHPHAQIRTINASDAVVVLNRHTQGTRS